MAAAETGAFPGGKVGGMGDVVRDIPKALAEQGQQVDVITPGYQYFSTLPGAVKKGSFRVPFRTGEETVEIFLIQSDKQPQTRNWVLESPAFAPDGAGKIYCDDPSNRAFATDASKFALFSIAVCQILVDGLLEEYQVIHLHDWHCAPVSVLAHYDPRYASLKARRLVYTIHNLSLQGIRPLQDDESSFFAWYPWLKPDLSKIHDLHYENCFNPMRAAINLCDRIHAVSPTYACEIQKPTEPETGFVGGEGLEKDLQNAAREKRLVGILNGCEYPEEHHESQFDSFLISCQELVERWMMAGTVDENVHTIALQRISEWRKNFSCSPSFLMTSVGRLADQKVRLLMERLDDGRSSFELILELVEPGIFVMLGRGNTEIEQFFTSKAVAKKNFLFLRGFDETLSAELYQLGDLFLMPSSFEPCGISQMLAMRAGQPCLVHGVGGLKDTVKHRINGFVFEGPSTTTQVDAMVRGFIEALDMKRSGPDDWQVLADNARATRFLWSEFAGDYVSLLYS